MTMQHEEEEEQEQQPLMLLPLGYKFRPTDRELLFHFLKNKLKDPTAFQSEAPIYDIQLYDHHPKIILDNFGVQGHNNNPECYVFTMRNRKFLRGDKANRILKDNVGYWRASYNHVDNFQERSRGVGLVGQRMNLVYYDTTTTTSTTCTNTSDKKGSKKGMKTDWLMNEYKIKPADNDDGAEEDLVLCKIYFNNRQRNKGSNHPYHQQQQYNMQQEQPYLQQQQQQYMQQEQQPPEQPYLQQQQEQYMQQEQPYLQQQQQQYMQQQQSPPEQPYLQQQQEQYMQQEQPYLQQQQQQQSPPEQPYLQQQQEQYMQQEQPHLLQQEQLAAVNDQAAASNTGTYSIDAHTFWDQLMSQEPEPQQTGMGMISIDDYAY